MVCWFLTTGVGWVFDFNSTCLGVFWGLPFGYCFGLGLVIYLEVCVWVL